MAKIIRKTLLPFGSSGPTSSFGQFGSKQAGVPQTSQDPKIIQQLSAWGLGWQSAIVGSDKAAYLEDMNGWCFVHSYELAYVLQMGIPEWDASTPYFKNSVVQDNAGLGQWFKSLQDNNTGNPPPVSSSNANWSWVNAPAASAQTLPPGAIIDFAGPLSKIPVGFLNCDGAPANRVGQAPLFAAIGITWGAGDGVSTFNVPNLNRRTTVGAGGAGTAALGNAVGNTGGEEQHTLLVSEIPSHSHSQAFLLYNFGPGNNGVGNPGTQTSQSTGSTGGGGSHNNIQPSAVVLKIIKT